MAAQSQQHYLDLLGVKPGASMDEVHTAYYLLIEKYAHNPTENEVEEQLRLQHAYNVLCRSYDPPARVSIADRGGREAKLLLRTAAILLAIGIPVLVALNFSALKLRMIDYDPGTVLRLKDRQAPYGTILRYDREHRFHTGAPTPAYEIRLHESDETVWLSRRVVVKGMEPAGAAR